MTAGNWKAVGVVAEGELLEISGVNVWSQEWDSLNEPLELPHPIYPSEHLRHFVVYRIPGPGKRIVFAAGELSPNVWGFYVSA